MSDSSLQQGPDVRQLPPRAALSLLHARFPAKQPSLIGNVLGADPSRQVDLLLVNSPLKDYDRSPRIHEYTLPVLGLGYIATVASEHGFNVGVLDAEACGLGLSEIVQCTNALQPRWLGLNLLAPTYVLARSIAGRVDSSVNLLLGGHHAKAMPQSILTDSGWPRIDAMILGEAEFKVPMLLANGAALARMTGVAWRDVDGTPHMVNAASPDPLVPHDLDVLPFVRRDFLTQDPFRHQDGEIEASIVASRGCPYDCSFCGAARSANPGVGVRMRTPGNIIRELQYLIEEYECTAFRFVDDLFLANISFMKDCLQCFVREAIPSAATWGATGRINVLSHADESLLDLLVESGCREVALGIESGSLRVLRLMDKQISPEMAEAVVRRLTSRGIDVKGYFILGYPGETRADLAQTVQFIRDLWEQCAALPGRFRISPFEFRPYPGTPVWNTLLNGQYTPAQLMAYRHVDLTMNGRLLHMRKRDEFNFSVDQQFSETPLDELRSTLVSLTKEQARQQSICPRIERRCRPSSKCRRTAAS